MSAVIAASVIASAVIGAGSSLYQADQAKKAQEKADAKREEARRIEEARLAQIAADTKPEEESATVNFGEADSGEAGGSYDDFLVSKSSTSALGSGTGSGLNSSGALSSLAM